MNVGSYILITFYFILNFMDTKKQFYIFVQEQRDEIFRMPKNFAKIDLCEHITLFSNITFSKNTFRENFTKHFTKFY